MRRSPSSIPGVLSLNLVITNINIQSVEPVDEETLKSLQKSQQIAIPITTDAQEAAASNNAERIIAGIDDRDLLS